MNKYFITIILAIFCMTMSAQNKNEEEFKKLLDANKYETVIQQYEQNKAEYSAKSLYYVGVAYYMKQDDNNCIKLMNLSIEKDAKDSGPYYIKGATLNYMDKYEEAIKCFNTAIELKPDDAEFYSGLGDSYYNLQKNDLALESYKKATAQTKCSDRPYSMIAQIYGIMNDNEKSLAAFYIAKSAIDKNGESYKNALYNIGLLESLKGNYDKAEPAFIELLQIDPLDYHSCAKLIQIYYHRKDYDKATPYRSRLYDAFKKGELKDNMKDKFCFDQFEWNGKLVQVFERYEEGKKTNIYYKQIFYVFNSKGDVELTVQTEYSPVSVELGGPKYLLCATKDNAHSNPGIGFNDNFKYEDLKAAAIKMFGQLLK